MQRHHNPIASTNFEEGLLGSNFPVYIDECPHNHRCSVQQHKLVYYNDDADSECISELWENWLKITSELQTLSDEVFDVSSSACMSTLPSNFSSQTSANSLPHSNTNTPEAINTSFVEPSPLSSDTSSCVTNELLDTSMDILTAANPPPLEETNLAATLPLSLEIGAGQPPLYLKARASPHKMKTPRTIRNHRHNRTRENEEAKTFLVESIAVAIDDGYVWHKYGQKNIKNRIHPRGYFRCAKPDCPVKKQTESSSDMQGFLSITYFGKHNH